MVQLNLGMPNYFILYVNYHLSVYSLKEMWNVYVMSLQSQFSIFTLRNEWLKKLDQIQIT